MFNDNSQNKCVVCNTVVYLARRGTVRVEFVGVFFRVRSTDTRAGFPVFHHWTLDYGTRSTATTSDERHEAAAAGGLRGQDDAMSCVNGKRRPLLKQQRAHRPECFWLVRFQNRRTRRTCWPAVSWRTSSVIRQTSIAIYISSRSYSRALRSTSARPSNGWRTEKNVISVSPMFVDDRRSFINRFACVCVVCLAVKNDGSPFSGGLLADELYVAKVVEVLGCVVENPANNEVLLHLFLSGTLVSLWFFCFFLKLYHEKIVSALCDQFASSLTLSSTNETDKNVSMGRAVSDVLRVMDGTSMVIGDDCQLDSDRFQCNATLIIVPHSTLDEWTDKASFPAYLYSWVQIVFGCVKCVLNFRPPWQNWVWFTAVSIMTVTFNHMFSTTMTWSWSVTIIFRWTTIMGNMSWVELLNDLRFNKYTHTWI